VLEVLSPRRLPTRVDLTVSYRTPEEVLAFAAPTLEAASVDLTSPRPVRRAGVNPLVEEVDSGNLLLSLVAAVNRECAAVAPGRVAVIVSESCVTETVSQLRHEGVDAVDPLVHESRGLSADLVVLAAEGANGLEFDAVVVVNPARIARRESRDGAPTARGLRTLYVSMTRPTRRLSIVSSEPLPASIIVARARQS
jgi:DNA helicase IV